MANVLRGKIKDGAYVTGPVRSTWKVFKGGQTIVTYTGSKNDIVALATNLQLQGWETTVEEGPVWKCTAVYAVDLTTGGGTTEPEPEPIWEIHAAGWEQNILDCVDRPFIRELDSSTKRRIEYLVKNGFSDTSPIEINKTNINTIPQALLLYHLMVQGVEGKQVFTPSVSRQIICSRQYNCRWTLDNVGKVLSKNRLISTYNLPTNVAVLLPESDSGIQEDQFTHITTFKGYLEQYPIYQTVPSNKAQITQEWVFNKWSVGDNGLYDVVM